MPCASRSACSAGCRRRRRTGPRFPTASPTSSLCCGPAGSSSTRPTRSSTTPRPRSRTGWSGGRTSPSPSCSSVARQVRRDGVIREVELELPKGPAGRPGLVVGARVAPLGSEHVLLLVDDRSEARRLEEIRRDFVANVSHELKTPVGGAGPPGRGRARRARRPGGRGPVRPADAGRDPPVDAAGAGDRGPLPAAGGRLAQRTAAPSTWPRRPARPSTGPGSPPRTRTSRSPSCPAGTARSGATTPCSSRPSATSWATPSPTPRRTPASP